MSNAAKVKEIRRAAAELAGIKPDDVRVVLAPYRICPLGAHIDHQLGSVTAMAIDRAVHLAFVPSGSREVKLASLSFPGEVRFSLDDVPAPIPGDWGNYIRGAVRALAARHRLTQGVVGVTWGECSGAGLSSSAAFGVACLTALEAVNGLTVSTDENILLDQAIENGYLGRQNGILDQAAMLVSRRGKLSRIDCATRQYEVIEPGAAMPPWTILLAFSGMTKSLEGTDYGRRVEECRDAARALLAAAGKTADRPLLGLMSPTEYAQHKHVLSGAAARRAKHFFGETERVAQGIEAWRRGDMAQFGRLMTESGASSIHNYESGAPPLATLYELLAASPGVYGTRPSGAGFRGCCVALVDPAAVADVAGRVEREYRSRHPELAAAATMLVCDSDDAARIV